MGEAGRLARGEANYKAGKFLDNAETVAYAATLKVETPKKEEPKKKAKEE